MFGRKVDPQERQEVVNLSSLLSLASKEIDTAVDGMKMQMAQLEIKGSADALITAATDAGKTVESVRADTTKPGFWPELKDKVGAKRSLETYILREELFKHQLWRLKLYGDLAVSLGNGWVDENAANEGIKATEAYEKKLKQTVNAMIKLGNHYKISPLEYIHR